MKMPPGKKLPAETIAAIVEWVDRGADWTAQVERAKPVASKHWAFQPVVKPSVPWRVRM